MRKQTKKILSLVMSAAMALSLGAGVDMTKAEAADALTWSGSATFADEWSMETIEVKTDEGSTISLAGMNFNSVGATIKVDVSAFKNPTIKVTATEGKVDGNFGVTSNDWKTLYVGVNDKKDVAGNDALIPATQTTIEGKLDPTVTEYNLTAPGRTVTKIEITEGDATAAPSEDPATPSEEPSAAPSEEPSAPTVPTSADLVGTAQLDSQANGWCGNEDCVNTKADINGVGTYTVSSNWDEVQDDPQAYCALRIADLDKYAAFITFSDVTVWVDGKVVDMPVIYGGDKDCRIQLWNNWANDGVGAGCETPETFPESFYEIKVQFTIGIRDTERDWDAEALDSTLITVNTAAENYEPERKPEGIDVPTEPTEPAKPAKNAAKSVKAAKKSATVKKGKKASLTFKVTAADNKKVTTDKVSATSSNKKVVKVTKVTTKAGKVVVSVKGVKKGSAKVTVKVGTKKATTKVKVK